MSDGALGSILSLFVQGRPRTKGSLKPIVDWKKRTVRLVEDHAHSAPWRKDMQRDIVRKIREGVIPGEKFEPYSGPIKVTATFYFERNGPTAQTLPFPTLNAGENANGDLDKLIRNLLDAMEGCGLIANDCMVVDLNVRKRWSPTNLPPGVQFSVTEAQA